MHKSAKVITTVFLGRMYREHTILCGNPQGYFIHSQDFQTPESVIELIKLCVKLDEETDPGSPTDLIIVNNNVDHAEGNAFLDSLDGKPIHSGKIRILHRENSGRAFGGYNEAFKTFRDEYDFFVFTEDDILIKGDGYIKYGIETLLSDKKIGAAAYEGISNEGADGRYHNRNLHCHSGAALISSAVLGKVYDKYGSLPYCKNEDQSYENIIVEGEIAFTNVIHKLGYKLVHVESMYKHYTYAYDYMRGIDVIQYKQINPKY